MHAEGALPWLLTASNTGEISMWDLSLRSSDGTPKLLITCNDIHEQGIFSMHARTGDGAKMGDSRVRAATASKDASVAVSQVAEGSFPVIARWRGAHEGVVKCVRWRDDSTLASCGNDRCAPPKKCLTLGQILVVLKNKFGCF